MPLLRACQTSDMPGTSGLTLGKSAPYRKGDHGSQQGPVPGCGRSYPSPRQLRAGERASGLHLSLPAEESSDTKGLRHV